ncbi:MAG: response regulator [Chitinophagaceae bacterium]|nr:response regulator [Chitinophagaceae bacterium]MDB5223171.1 response regulator [Chitinophagaceae bacterium]
MYRILVVDDDQSILDAMEIALSLQDYEVDTTTKGEETFSKIKSFKPDLIFMDVYLSGMDGREICKQIKENENTRHIPVIIFSANKSMKEVFEESGANDFIGKPFNMDELYEKVKNQTSHILY